MANGEEVHEGAVASNDYPLGTLLEIDGRTYIVKDRMMDDGKVDIYMRDITLASRYGVQRKTIKILEEE